MRSSHQLGTPPSFAKKTNEMRAAVLAKPHQFEIQNVPLPKPGKGEVRVRVQYCGICSSNLGPWKGASWFSYPFPPGAPGHEASGVVEETGEDVSQVAVGQRVATLSNQAFAEYLIAKAQNLISISSIPGESPFLGEPLGCAVNVFKRAQIRPGDWVAIVGIGFFGSILLQLCRREGARVIAISRRISALQTAAKLGAEYTIEMKERSGVVSDVRRVAGDNLCDVVIEAAGVQPTLDLAGDLCRTRGRLVIAGYHQDGLRTVNMQQWNWNGLDVINAHEREEPVYIAGIRQAVDLVSRGAIQLDGLISRTFPIQEIEDGFRLAEERPEGFMKAVVVFE